MTALRVGDAAGEDAGDRRGQLVAVGRQPVAAVARLEQQRPGLRLAQRGHPRPIAAVQGWVAADLEDDRPHLAAPDRLARLAQELQSGSPVPP
jgi:hypothetical protein